MAMKIMNLGLQVKVTWHSSWIVLNQKGYRSDRNGRTGSYH